MLAVKKLIFLVFLAGVFWSVVILETQAQETRPELLITWRASSYVPLGFEGRVFPSEGTPVLAALEVIDGRGRLVDLSLETIYWYLDGDLIRGGTGIQQASFRARRGANALRVQLPDFPGRMLLKTVMIPGISPEAVIGKEKAGDYISGSTRVWAYPYFFNVADVSALEMAWTVNGQKPSNLENPEILDINLSPETPNNSNLNIGLVIKNKGGVPEAASDILRLVFVK